MAIGPAPMSMASHGVTDGADRVRHIGDGRYEEMDGRRPLGARGAKATYSRSVSRRRLLALGIFLGLSVAVVAIGVLRHRHRLAPMLRVASASAHATSPEAAQQQLWSSTCSGMHTNCWETKCCSDPAHTCFAKDLGWAECKTYCSPHSVNWNEAKEFQTLWSCDRVVPGLKPLLVLPPVSETDLPKLDEHCIEEFHNCTASKCCNDPGMHCFKKNDKWAVCKRGCLPGICPGDPKKWQTPWTCEVLDNALHTDDNKEKMFKLKIPPSVVQDPTADKKLYCFSLMMAQGYEVDMLRTQLFKGAGIFRCENYSVYSNSSVLLRPKIGDKPRINTDVIPGSMQCEFGGVYNTALNTEVFVRVWKKVFSDNIFTKYDWTVKVDPDAVFLPDRLRDHASRYLYLRLFTSASPVYLNNCKDGLHGPIEVISLGGMESFRSGITRCEDALRGEFDQFGEDVFLRHCLKLLGVVKADDFGMLQETACDPFPDKPMPCVSGKVAFHPLKSPVIYFQCLDQAEMNQPH